MSLLCVTVKRARLQGTLEDFHAYVTLKLQNVKSTTVAVKGVQPQWEQEFIFETNRLDQGLILELWNKGVLWDKLLGVCFMPLRQIKFEQIPGPGQWFQIDQEFRTVNGECVGTIRPTGHSVLVDCRFELPYGVDSVADAHKLLEFAPTELPTAEGEGVFEQEVPNSDQHNDYFENEEDHNHNDHSPPPSHWPIEHSSRLDRLNRRLIGLDPEEEAEGAEEPIGEVERFDRGGALLLDATNLSGGAAGRAGRAPLSHSAISEDSDYTSDISFPTGLQQQHQANASIHQFESHLRPHGIYRPPNEETEIGGPRNCIGTECPSTSASWQWGEEKGDEGCQQFINSDQRQQHSPSFYLGTQSPRPNSRHSCQYLEQQSADLDVEEESEKVEGEKEGAEDYYAGMEPNRQPQFLNSQIPSQRQQFFHPNFHSSANSPPSPTPQHYDDVPEYDQYFENAGGYETEGTEYAPPPPPPSSQSPRKAATQNVAFHGNGPTSSQPSSVYYAPNPSIMVGGNNSLIGRRIIEYVDELRPSDSFELDRLEQQRQRQFQRRGSHQSSQPAEPFGPSGRAGFTDSRSSNSTVQAANRSRTGFYDSESDGFTSTGTVIPVNIRDHPDWRNTIYQQQQPAERRLDEEEYLAEEDRNEPKNFGGSQFGYTTDEGEEERMGRREIGEGEEWMEPEGKKGGNDGREEEYTTEEEEPDYVVEHFVDDDRRQQPKGMESDEVVQSGSSESGKMTEKKLTEEELEMEEYEAKLMAAGRRYDSRPMSRTYDGYGSGGGASSTYSVGSSDQSGTANNRFYEDIQQPGTSQQISAIGGYPFQEDQNIHQHSSILMDEEPLSYNSRPAQSSSRTTTNRGGNRRLSAISQQQQRNSWGSTVQGMNEDYGIGYEDPLRGEGGFYTQGGLFIHDEFDAGIAGVGGSAIEEVAEEEEEEEVQNEEAEYEIDDEHREMGQQKQQQRIPLAVTKVREQEKPMGDGEGQKNYKQLWKWAYREACKQAGISVGANYVVWEKCWKMTSLIKIKFNGVK